VEDADDYLDRLFPWIEFQTEPPQVGRRN
jgi:hypothetical protein